jgi:hypothetical protein
MASAPFGAVKVFDAPARSPGDVVMTTKYPRGALGLHGFSGADRAGVAVLLIRRVVVARPAAQRQSVLRLADEIVLPYSRVPIDD